MNLLEQDTVFSFGKRLLDIFNYEDMYLYYFLFFIALIAIAFIGGKYYSAIFVYPTLIFFVVIFNPISIKLFDKIRLIPQGRFYRFFWVPPVVIGIAFTVTFLINKVSDRKTRILAVLIASVFLILCGNPNKAIEYYSGMTNIYKVSQYVIDISECIHSDFGEGTPTLYYDDTFVYQYRTYDWNVISYRVRGESLPTMTDEEALEIVKRGSARQILELALIHNKRNLVAKDALVDYLSEIDYVILHTSEGIDSYCEELGLKHIGNYNNYKVYRNTGRVKK